MLWSDALFGMVVCLAGLGDFPDRLRIRHANPLAIADVPGRKDEESLKATVVADTGPCSAARS